MIKKTTVLNEATFKEKLSTIIAIFLLGACWYIVELIGNRNDTHKELLFSQTYLETVSTQDMILSPIQGVVSFCQSAYLPEHYIHLYEETFQQEIQTNVLKKILLSDAEKKMFEQRKKTDSLETITVSFHTLQKAEQSKGKEFTKADYCRFLNENAVNLILEKKRFLSRFTNL